MNYVNNPMPYGYPYYSDNSSSHLKIALPTTNTPENTMMVTLGNFGIGINEIECLDAAYKLFNACNAWTAANKTFTRIVLIGAENYFYPTGMGYQNLTEGPNQLAQFVMNAHLRGIMVTYGMVMPATAFPLDYRNSLLTYAMQLRRYQNARKVFGTQNATVDPGPLNGTPVTGGCIAGGATMPGLKSIVAADDFPPNCTNKYSNWTDGNYSANFDDVLLMAPFWTKPGYNGTTDDAARVPDICGYLDVLRKYLNMPVGYEVQAALAQTNPSVAMNGVTGPLHVHLVKHADFLYVISGVAHNNQVQMISYFTPWINAVKQIVGTGQPANPLSLAVPLFMEFGTTILDPNPPPTKAAEWTAMEQMAPVISGITTAHGFTGFAISDWNNWKVLP